MASQHDDVSSRAPQWRPFAYLAELGGWRGAIWPLLALMAFAALVMLPGAWLGHVAGHSSFYNISWAAEFSERLAMGDWWPRWLPGMNDGAGSAAFYFYGPLPFYLAAPFFWLVADERLAMVGATWLVLGLSGISCFALTRRYAATVPALVAAGLYMLMPYHFFGDIWVRAAFGEQAAFIFIPLCALFALQERRKAMQVAGLGLGYAGLLLSHLPSALLFGPFLAFFCLWSALSRRDMMLVVRAGLGGLLAFGLSAAYVLPALLTQDMVRPQHWDVFAPEDMLLFEPVVQFLSLGFGMASALLLVSTLALWRSPVWRDFLPWLVAGVIVMLIVTPLAKPLWEHAGVFRRAQFPWRILSLLDLAACVGVASVLQLAKAPWRLARLLAIGVTATVMLTAPLFAISTQVRFTPSYVEDEARLIQSRADPSEYLPGCGGPALAPGVLLARDAILWSQANTAIVSDTGLMRRFELAPGSTGPVILPVLYYPFLVAHSDGVPVATGCDPTTGFIRIAEPAQTVTVAHRPLEAEWLGLATSAVAIMITALLLFRRQR